MVRVWSCTPSLHAAGELLIGGVLRVGMFIRFQFPLSALAGLYLLPVTLMGTPLLAEAVLGLLPAQALTEFGLKQNFHDRTRVSKELEGMYLREARRGGAITALIAQERQLVPKDPEQWEQAHRTIQKPVLILWGRKDKLVPLAQGIHLKNDIAGSTLAVFPGVGHSPHLEAPQLVLDQILPFLREVGVE